MMMEEGQPVRYGEIDGVRVVVTEGEAIGDEETFRGARVEPQTTSGTGTINISGTPERIDDEIFIDMPDRYHREVENQLRRMSRQEFGQEYIVGADFVKEKEKKVTNWRKRIQNGKHSGN